MKPRILMAAAIAYLIVANLIWISHDTRPPFWDMANHQRFALLIHDEIAVRGLAGIPAIAQATEFYPPFYHLVVAGFYALLGRNFDAAAWANLPAAVLLLLATFGIGRTVLSELPAASAAVMVVFYPIMIWLSRETLIDYWLTSLVALSMWVLLKTEEFSHRRWNVAFGVCCGLGMLTKWTFPLFISLPFLWLARRRWKSAAGSIAVAGAIAAVWYVPFLSQLRDFSAINLAGAQAEGDPSLWSWQSLVFYWRALEGYQLFLPLFVGFIAGAVMLARKFEYPWIPIVLWAAGGWLALLTFHNKDPRYSAPLLPAVALVTAKTLESRPALIALLVPVLAFQHFMVSFGIPQLPQSIVLARGLEGPLTWNWNLYTQQYFGLWGPPAREDWRIDHVLDRMNATGSRVRLGLVPDIPRFDSAAFELTVALRKQNVSVKRVFGTDVAGDYVLTNRDGTPSYSAPGTPVTNDYIRKHTDLFEEIDSFPLPNGEIMLLYRVAIP